jgi:hypothetical protein
MISKLFGRWGNVVKEPTILICSIHDNEPFFKQDRAIYERHYRNINEYKAASMSDFLKFINGRIFDIVHIFVSIDPKGTIEGIWGIELFEHLSRSDVKLVIFALGNSGESYRSFYPNARLKGINPMNVVMTLDRKGQCFPDFFKSLFDMMASGDSMFKAWVKLAPQVSGQWHKDAPDTICDVQLKHLRFI